MAEQIQLFTKPVDIKRFEKYLERKDTLPDYPEIGFLYNVLCQCFMPYRDPGVSHWERRNGRYWVCPAFYTRCSWACDRACSWPSVETAWPSSLLTAILSVT